MEETELGVIDRPAIQRTYAAIRPYIRQAPVVEVDGRDFGLGPCSLAFKLEQLQRAGSFKTRGAFAHLLTQSIPAAGVAAASGGNHGAAVAYAARDMGGRRTSSSRGCRRGPRSIGFGRMARR